MALAVAIFYGEGGGGIVEGDTRLDSYDFFGRSTLVENSVLLFFIMGRGRFAGRVTPVECENPCIRFIFIFSRYSTVQTVVGTHMSVGSVCTDST